MEIHIEYIDSYGNFGLDSTQISGTCIFYKYKINLIFLKLFTVFSSLIFLIIVIHTRFFYKSIVFLKYWKNE
jgi:hypothetical protein